MDRNNKYVVFDRFERSVWLKRHFIDELDHWGYKLVKDFENQPQAIFQIKGKYYFTMFFALGENEYDAKPAQECLNALKEYASIYGKNVKPAVLPLEIEGFSRCNNPCKLKVKSHFRNVRFFYHGLYDIDGNLIVIDDLPTC